MKSTEEYLKENNKLADFERAVVLNDLQSIYSIVEDFVDSEVKNCSIPDVSQQRELLESFREEWNKPRFDRDGIYESDIDDFLEDSNESNCY